MLAPERPKAGPRWGQVRPEIGTGTAHYRVSVNARTGFGNGSAGAVRSQSHILLPEPRIAQDRGIPQVVAQRLPFGGRVRYGRQQLRARWRGAWAGGSRAALLDCATHDLLPVQFWLRRQQPQPDPNCQPMHGEAVSLQYWWGQNSHTATRGQAASGAAQALSDRNVEALRAHVSDSVRPAATHPIASVSAGLEGQRTRTRLLMNASRLDSALCSRRSCSTMWGREERSCSPRADFKPFSFFLFGGGLLARSARSAIEFILCCSARCAHSLHARLPLPHQTTQAQLGAVHVRSESSRRAIDSHPSGARNANLALRALLPTRKCTVDSCVLWAVCILPSRGRGGGRCFVRLARLWMEGSAEAATQDTAQGKSPTRCCRTGGPLSVTLSDLYLRAGLRGWQRTPSQVGSSRLCA